MVNVSLGSLEGKAREELIYVLRLSQEVIRFMSGSSPYFGLFGVYNKNNRLSCFARKKAEQENYPGKKRSPEKKKDFIDLMKQRRRKLIEEGKVIEREPRIWEEEEEADGLEGEID